MKASICSAIRESDVGETKVLEALIEAFSSEFSLREIASAYCKARRDPDKAAEILYDGQKLKNCSNAASAVITTQRETNSTSSSESLCESVDGKPNCANYWNSKASKTKQMSMGSVSGLISKGNVMPNTPAWGGVNRIWPLSETLGESVVTNWGADKGLNASKLKNPALSVGSVSGKCLICSRPACGPLGATKPLKLEMKDFQFDELTDDDVEDQMHTGQGRIFVGGLSPETNKHTLKDHFKKFGKVVETVIMKDKDTGSLRGFGYVLFSDSSVADKVLLERHVILGRLVGVEKAEPKPRFEHNNPCNQKGFNKKSNGNNGQFRTKKIFVGGLSPSLTEKEFKAYFEKFGRTTEVVIMHHSTKDRPRGFGFITFKSEEAVENVMQRRFHELDGKVLEVNRAVEKIMWKRFHELYGHNGGYDVRKDGGRGGSLAGGTNSSSMSGYGGPQLSGYASAGGTPVVSPRSPL
ncbi:hypothetical protein C5167_012490 [Papaver somniferum]|uniref:RRM domain-containing protein n=1 Tax=Papaver somniferum TaxID=3469 RepID=A0A4Y7IZL9_PAPSO|nr:heterogeneous nuclear ribonucleoprotein 1-like [Papaver somniferum]RZC53636.1 hypothetical protein C5167_012490 [Papaver somniferum]